MAAQSADPLTEVTLAVPGMVCDGCAERIRGLLAGMPGVEKVQTRPWRKQVHVRFDTSRVRAKEITDALGQAGFEVATA